MYTFASYLQPAHLRKKCQTPLTLEVRPRLIMMDTICLSNPIVFGQFSLSPNQTSVRTFTAVQQKHTSWRHHDIISVNSHSKA